VLGHERDVVENNVVGVAGGVLGFLVGGGNGSNNFGVGVLELRVATEGFALLLVFKFFYHYG
jgi:hypothetical protein